MNSEMADLEQSEAPVVFGAKAGDLYGVFADPPHATGGVAVLLLAGGGFLPMTHRNRMWVRLTRRLARHGCRVLRFDYHGIGESGGTTSEYVLDRPFVDDVEGAVRWLRSQGVSRLVMVGSCFGARTILAAGERIPELYAAVLLSTPLGRHRLGEGAATRFAETLTLPGYLRRVVQPRVLRRLRDPVWRARYWRVARVKVERMTRFVGGGQPSGRSSGLRWVSEKFLRPVRDLPRRGIRLCFLYGEDDEYYHEFRRAGAAGLDTMVGEANGNIEVRTVAGVLHGFTTSAMQDRAIDATCDWLLHLPIFREQRAAVGASSSGSRDA
jgi:pimeloyl-ACP methyl ester carboxylesterase